MSKDHSIQYEALRNVTSPHDKELGRARYCGVASADQFFELPDNLNVREYLQTEVNGKPIKKQTAVNNAIRETLDQDREKFTLLNGGISVMASAAQVDDKQRSVRMSGASIINGSQTRGVLKQYFCEENQDDKEFPWVNFEVIVCADQVLAAEISIARNFQNAVLPVSTYGAKGLFDELELAMQKQDPQIRLRKSETDVGDDFVDTEKLIQILTAIVPEGVRMPREDSPAGSGVRAYAFSQKAVCLKDYAAIMQAPNYGDAKQFFLEVAYDAWQVFNELKRDPNFGIFREKRTGKNVKKSPVKKDRQGNVYDVALGVLFPVLSALGKFSKKTAKGHWTFCVPEDFDMADLIKAAELTFSSKQDPAKMGKEPDCYLALHPIVGAYLKYRSPDHSRS
jgi:hypothetical protein